jgi:hypothetical protein
MTTFDAAIADFTARAPLSAGILIMRVATAPGAALDAGTTLRAQRAMCALLHPYSSADTSTPLVKACASELITARSKQWEEWAAKTSDDPRADLQALAEDVLVTTAGFLSLDVQDQEQYAPALVLSENSEQEAALIKQLRAGRGVLLGMATEARADHHVGLMVVASGAPMTRLVKALQRVLVEQWPEMAGL